MPIFICKAKDASGKTLRQQLIAKDSQEAVLSLRQKDLVPMSVEEIKARKSSFGAGSKRVNLTQLAQFSRQLATLVGAGMPLVKDFKILANQSESKRLQEISNSLCQYIEAGTSLSEAMGAYPQVFNSLYINMVSAGEASGALSDILERLAVYLEKTNSQMSRTKSALVYPAAIILVGLGISAFLVLVVIPRFKDIFSMLSAKLPLPTQILINVSDFSRKYFLLFIGIGFIVSWLIRRYISTTAGEFQFDAFKLKLPLLGPLFQKFSIARFSRTLATLLKSGVPILSSLDIVAKTMENKVMESRLTEVRRQVSQGQRIAAQLAKEKVFPEMVSEMIGVGEESGRLEQMLNKIADAYEEEVEAAINRLLSLLEPLIIVFLGLVVGSIVLAMFLPILKMTEVMGGK